MILIAHRGNVDGPSEHENSPAQILRAISRGFDVELDVWYRDGWYLGHDAPEYRVSTTYLGSPKFWIHCKDYQTLVRALDVGLHCFYHTDEDYVLTSDGYIWAYPGKPGGVRTICVMPERSGQSVSGFSGVCSDWINRYKADPV